MKNFRVLKDVTIGKLWDMWGAQPLTPLTAVIGKNGVGKSTFFDAFGFLADCLKLGVEEACDARGRGGFERIRSQGQIGPIEFNIYYRQEPKARPITYELAIELDGTGRPFVLKERLRQRRKGQKTGWPYSFLILNDAAGVVWKEEEIGVDEKDEKFTSEKLKHMLQEERDDRESIELEDKRKLGISTLGSLRQHPRISVFRRFIESWYLSYFRPDSARSLPLAGPQRHLNVSGDNIGNVVQYMEREHKELFQTILDSIAKKIPGIDKIDTEKTSDGRLLLRFNDKGFNDPFYSQQMSDGTLKVFAYMLLLNDPTPPPFICIEEPENGLYHKLLETLANEFREHTTGAKDASQVFITTHQPYFVNALSPDEVWVINKDKDGFASVKRASDDEIVKNLYKEELPLGNLWYSDYLDPR
ncbi:MAG: AAA family ATPase [Candidatus Magnetominusculus sp. LBB02]|nr:AAA family ATPase [Candidatus Magnetominusculus sp. LBB02]